MLHLRRGGGGGVQVFWCNEREARGDGEERAPLLNAYHGAAASAANVAAATVSVRILAQH